MKNMKMFIPNDAKFVVQHSKNRSMCSTLKEGGSNIEEDSKAIEIRDIVGSLEAKLIEIEIKNISF